MSTINLLPWREQRREERKKQFITTMVLIVICAGAVVLLADQFLGSVISNQNSRNEYIRGKNAELDRRIAEIQLLRAQRQQLIERMKIIQDLQGNRPIVSRVFDQLVRTLPDGVYFKRVQMSGASIAIEGEAESNSLVSNLMRRQDASGWLTAPNLLDVKASNNPQLEQASEFRLTVKQTRPRDEEQPEQGVR